MRKMKRLMWSVEYGVKRWHEGGLYLFYEQVVDFFGMFYSCFAVHFIAFRQTLRLFVSFCLR
jgi:hypothetical protein